MMAAKDVKMAADNLSCPVCYQLFKNPKYLPCHHFYCEQCLEMIKEESKIICPECRKEANIPPGGVKDLDNNFFINRLVDELILNRKVEGEAEVKCDECSGEDPVVTFCPDCTMFLCHLCNEHHKRSNKSRSHGIVSLTELRSKKDIVIQPKPKAMMCREHDIELLFYCETCDQLVCMYCTVKDHHGHNHDTVKKVVGKHREMIKETTALVEEMIRGLNSTHDNIEKVRMTISQQGNEVKKKIDQHYDGVIQKLTNEKEQLKQRVADTVSQKEKAVTTKLSEVEYVQAEVLKMKKLKDDVEKSFDPEVLSVKKEVIDRMQQITDKYKKVNIPPVQQATMEFVPTKEIPPQFGLLRSAVKTDSHKYKAKIEDHIVDKLLNYKLPTQVTKEQYNRPALATLATSHSRGTSTSTAQLASASTTGVRLTGVAGMTVGNAMIAHQLLSPVTSQATPTTGKISPGATSVTPPHGMRMTMISTPATPVKAITSTNSTKVTPTSGLATNIAAGVSSTSATPVRAITSMNSTKVTPTSGLATNIAAGVSSPGTVTVPGNKRKRCQKCDGCKAPKCLSCKFCLHPALKKPCIMKACKQLQ